MKEEFPQLEQREYQKQFLDDWFSRNKLFRDERASGKTTMMLCEAKRFDDAGFDVLFLSDSNRMKIGKMKFQNLFHKFSKIDFGNYRALSKGKFMGYNYDVVILDEFQNITLVEYNRFIAPMQPKFMRASACMSSMNNHWLINAGCSTDAALFDSIYER